MIVIYNPHPTPRTAYTFKLACADVMGVEYRIVNDEEEFINSPGVRLNYSFNLIENTFQVVPSGLLFETGLKEFQPPVGKWDELPVLFPNQSTRIPFDIFSAIFYMVVRYEEYLPHKTDQYGRFMAEESIAFRNDFLRLPVVELWCRKLASVLKIEKQCRNLSPQNFRFHLTVDIDNPWMYKNKGMYSVGGLMKELLKLDFPKFKEKYRIIKGKKADPADTYEMIRDLNIPVNYFILCRRSGKNDKNRSLKKKIFRQLIKDLERSGTVGIHPSYDSAQKGSLMKKETDFLSGILGRQITASRQHYLMLNFPDTYRNLLKLEIAEDYSMGYSSQTGFRAGISRSYPFYDLLLEKETGLRIIPFQIMDRTLLSYLNMEPETAIPEFDYYREMIMKVGGEFVILWHNDSLSDYGEWEGWNKVFRHSLGVK